MAFNINKLFPFLSIRKKLIIAFTFLSFVPLVVIGIAAIYSYTHTMNQIASTALSNDVCVFNERAQRFLTSVEDDIEYLCCSPAFVAYLDAVTAGDPSEIDKARTALLDQLIAFVKYREIYYRMRFVDHENGEQFRVEFADSDFVVVPQDRLSDARFTFYSLLTASVPAGNARFAPVEFQNDEGARIPAISCAVPVPTGNRPRSCTFVADIFAGKFFDAVEAGFPLDPHSVFAIVTGDGYYFYHSEKKTDWNKLLATREEETLFDDFSPVTATTILSGSAGVLTSGHNDIVVYAPLFVPRFTGATAYYIFASASKSFVLRPALRFSILLVGLLIAFLTISILFGYLATNQLAGPIRQLQEGAEIVAQGNYQHRLNIQTNDEIEQLAHQFNRMADELSEREQLLEGHQKRLEETVVERTLELQGEKEKLQAIVDNVPSAFILLDEKGSILSASAQIVLMAGVSPGEAVGRTVPDIFPGTVRVDVSEDDILSPAGTPPLSVMTVNGGTREQRLIEKRSIPLSLHNEHGGSLEILTDITERKKMEAHWLHAERLAATGEMAAIIAHEIRNSLTSVKMILQLQQESSLSDDERSSLDVAVKSIHHAEDVVNDLLRFARPAKPTFKACDMGAVIDESLAFARPHFEKKRVALVQALSPDLPHALADREHMKEALINILLNAVQAIDESGTVEVTSTVTTMSVRREDYAYATGGSRTARDSRPTVVLEQGADVIEITIKDDGPGIPRDRIDKIFDPFYTTKLGGTGLGLTMVKRTVNQHQGIILAESPNGSGALFQILLPAMRTP